MRADAVVLEEGEDVGGVREEVGLKLFFSGFFCFFLFFFTE